MLIPTREKPTVHWWDIAVYKEVEESANTIREKCMDHVTFSPPTDTDLVDYADAFTALDCGKGWAGSFNLKAKSKDPKFPCDDITIGKDAKEYQLIRVYKDSTHGDCAYRE